MSLTLTIENSLFQLRVQAESLGLISAALVDISFDRANFDYVDISELLDKAESAIGKIRSKSVEVSRLLTEQRETEGEPVGRRREETA